MKYLLILLSSVLLLTCQNDIKIKLIILRKQNHYEDKNSSLFEYNDLNNNYKYIVIHHSALNKESGYNVIMYLHMYEIGYSDIGYHYIIEKNGDVYEGRSIKYMGAHAGQTKEANELADSIRANESLEPIEEALKLDPDYGSIGICLDGNFEIIKPNEEQLNSLKKLLEYLIKKYKIKKYNILLHSEVKEKIIKKNGLTFIGKETVCPGKFASSKLKKIIRKL